MKRIESIKLVRNNKKQGSTENNGRGNESYADAQVEKKSWV